MSYERKVMLSEVTLKVALVMVNTRQRGSGHSVILISRNTIQITNWVK